MAVTSFVLLESFPAVLYSNVNEIGAKNIFLALIEIVFLLIFIIITLAAFSKVDKWAAILLIPYLLWVGFATILNASIWLLNTVY